MNIQVKATGSYNYKNSVVYEYTASVDGVPYTRSGEESQTVFRIQITSDYAESEQAKQEFIESVKQVIQQELSRDEQL
jgi:hypothetical protein